ncbi:hypothetical protein N657DRAFT_405735 [Parathielavia appendiculata]|uniref:Uncharacterized protein n=1 Tax=Parathielavia appendiculata TaxID=2587402 RepID=A0AAN6TPD7_9PEZI|nr:hypothetical protein N657DRAFT_405735 [Parathielavia appendiculata]
MTTYWIQEISKHLAETAHIIYLILSLTLCGTLGLPICPHCSQNFSSSVSFHIQTFGRL